MAVSVTIATLRTKLQIILDDVSGRAYSTDRLNQFLNMALNHCEEFVQEWGAKYLVVSDDLTMVEDQVEYAIDKEILNLHLVTFQRLDGSFEAGTPIRFADRQEYDTLQAGVPMFYYRRGTKLGILPKPDGTHAGQTIRVWSAKMGDDLSGTTAIGLPPWMRDMVLFLAASYCASSKGDDKAKRLFERDFMLVRDQKLVTLTQWQRQEPELVRDLWAREFGVVTATFSSE